jgi:hypothetical protein
MRNSERQDDRRRIFYLLAGHFCGRYLDIPLIVVVRENRISIQPNGVSLITRLGEPYLELSSNELKEVRAVKYRLFFPIPAVELRYSKKSEEGCFVIGFSGMQWQRNRFIQALIESGFQSCVRNWIGSL